MRNGVVAGKAKLRLGMKVELADNGGGPCCGCPCGWETTCCYLRPEHGDVGKEWSSATSDAGAVSAPGRVTFNGLFAGYMREGTDGQTQEVEINTEWIRFGTRTPGGEPTAGENILEVTPIGELTLGGVRRTTPAWAALEFQAMYPVVMIHGNNDDGSFFEKNGFTQPFVEQVSRSITVSTCRRTALKRTATS